MYATPLTFDIVTPDYFEGTKAKDVNKDEFVPSGYRFHPSISKDLIKQAPYNFGTAQLELYLKVETDYYIVPSLYKRGQSGEFYVNVYGDCEEFILDGAAIVVSAQKPMMIGDQAMKLSVSQFYEKKEQLRDKLVAEVKRLNIPISTIEGNYIIYLY